MEVELKLVTPDMVWKPELVGSQKGSVQALVERWLTSFLEVSQCQPAGRATCWAVGAGSLCAASGRASSMCVRQRYCHEVLGLRTISQGCRPLLSKHRLAASSSAWTLVRAAMPRSWRRTMMLLTSWTRCGSTAPVVCPKHICTCCTALLVYQGFRWGGAVAKANGLCVCNCCRC